MLWRVERLIVELDAPPATLTRRGHETTIAICPACRRHRVLRYSWRQVTRDRYAVAADIRRALRAGTYA